VTQKVRTGRTPLLALFLAVAVGGWGAAQTAPASISIIGLPESAAAGSEVAFTVTVLDEAGAPVTGYAGTVHFSSSLLATALPDDYRYGPGDGGSHRFSFTPGEAGTGTITVSDAEGGLYGSQRVGVEAASASLPATASSTPAVSPSAADHTTPPRRSAVAVGDADNVTPPAPASAVYVGAAPANHLYFVAHQDDDLLFLNPDVEDSIRQGLRVRTVFLTAAASSPGPPPPGPPAWYAREDSVPRAYRAMANVAQQPNDWTCAAQTYLTNKVVRVCTLSTQPLVSVVFMRLPDGGTDPINQPGMAALWAGSVPSLTSLTRPDDTPPTPSSTYTRSELVQVLAALIADFAPDRIGTQDSTQAYGPDHADHVASAQFALEAEHTYARSHELRMYRGYNVDVWWTPPVPSPEVPNLSPAQHNEKLRVMEAYGGTLPPGSQWEPFCSRRYALSRVSGGTGPLAGPGGGCIDAGSHPVDGDPAVVAPCSGTSSRWTVTADGRIAGFTPIGRVSSMPGASVTHGGSRVAEVADPVTNAPPHRLPAITVFMCLVVNADGVVRVSGCADSPEQTWTRMSNGQILGAGATCLGVGSDGVTLQAQACQADTSTDKYKPIATQQWVQRMADPATWSSGSQFSDADLGSPAIYAGSFRLGDVNGDGYADACIRLADGVHCALNTAAGAFSPHSLYSAAFSDAAGWRPDAYGSTLQMGDINGDGKADVCGRSGNGIFCATANADGTSLQGARLWSTGADFSDAAGWGTAASYYGSIRLADVNGDGYADVCGRGSTGIVCALNNRAGAFAPAQAWIADFSDAQGWQAAQYGSTIQFGDVNGDGKADVCGRGPAGIQCAIANASGTGFTDTHLWSLRSDFSDANGWGGAAGYYGSIRLADVDGDGRADLCGRSGGGIVCGISNGGGFDVTLAVMPGGYTDALGWSPAPYGATLQFGDLGHDGRRDVCGRGPAGLVCAKAP